jgi:molybdopterin-guanine dinucleotide biosynthesis protein B
MQRVRGATAVVLYVLLSTNGVAVMGTDGVSPVIVCIVGASGVGKTTLIESVIPLLRREGLRVGVLKHTHHTITLDLAGKDTWRHAQAGAEQVALLGPSGLAYIDYGADGISPEAAIARHFSSMDIVLIEGYKWGPLPKVEVYRRALLPEPMCAQDARLCALVTDDLVSTPLPVFSSADHQSVARFLTAFVADERTDRRPHE